MPKKSAEEIIQAPAASDLEATVKEALEAAPEPSEEAIAAHAQREAAQAAEEAGEIEAGQVDPVTGKKKRKPYKKRESKLNVTSDKVVIDVKNFRNIGYQIADTIIIAGQTLGGEDWKPVIHKSEKNEILYDERSNLREAWADMAEYYKWEKFPVWITVTLATAAYVGPRLNAPSTISRMDKLKLWWEKRKMEKEAKKKAEGHA